MGCCAAPRRTSTLHRARQTLTKRQHGRHGIEAQVSEIVGMKNEIKEAMTSLKKWMKPTRAKTVLAYALTFPTVYHEPKGNVLVIGTWKSARFSSLRDRTH